MALPDYFKRELGAIKAWRNTAGDAALTLTSLANGAARQGGKVDLGSAFDSEWSVVFESAVAIAAANKAEIEVWWGASLSGTTGSDNPGNLTGADGSLSNPDEVKYQLDYVGSLVLANSLGTNVQRQVFSLRPKLRYGMPVIVNRSGQALSSTAGNHVLRLTPIMSVVQESA